MLLCFDGACVYLVSGSRICCLESVSHTFLCDADVCCSTNLAWRCSASSAWPGEVLWMCLSEGAAMLNVCGYFSSKDPERGLCEDFSAVMLLCVPAGLDAALALLMGIPQREIAHSTRECSLFLH